MLTQDPYETDEFKASDYRKKICKYKLLVNKFNKNNADALKTCATNDFKLIENIPQE